jgi:hypothetical protein
MLFLFLLIALLGGCGLIIGNALLVRLDPGQCFDRVGDRAVVSSWLGLLILVNLFLTIALFRPLSPSFVVPATLLLLIISLWPRQNRYALNSLYRLPATGILGLAALALGAAAYCSQVIVWYDTGLYHIQAINWFSEFGLVPGVALIHSRLGYVSSWFTLPALFNHGFLQGRIASLPGAFCLFLLLCHGLVAFVRLARHRGRIQDIFIFCASLLVLAVVLLWGMPNSPSPDFPVAILVILVGWAMLAISRPKDDQRQTDRFTPVTVIPLVLAVGTASIKLSALPLVVVAGCFYLLSGRASLKKTAVSVSLVALALAPTAAAGIVASGCAFYPVSFLCADLPWSLGAASANAESMLIRDWNRWGMFAPEYATSWNWIVPWLRMEKTSAALLFLSLTAIVSLSWSRASNLFKQSGLIYVVVLGVSGIAFMLYGAPTWRMGLGYLVVLPALALAVRARFSALLQNLGRIAGRSFGLAGVAIAIVLALHIHLVPRPSYRLLDSEIAKRFVGDDRPHFNLWIPPRIVNFGYDDQTTGKTIIFENRIVDDVVGDIIYRRPEDLDKSDLCWEAPLPCSPYKLEGIRSRQRGFMKVQYD